MFTNTKKDENVSLSINGVIEKMSKIHFLGIIVDDELTWKPCVAYTQNKM